MSPAEEDPGESGIFDPPARTRKPPAKRKRSSSRPSKATPPEPDQRPIDLPLFSDNLSPAAPATGNEIEATQPQPETEPRFPVSRPVAFRRRVAAGIADLCVHAAALAAALAAMQLVEIPLYRSQWPALGLFLLVFSFIYHVIPLAFWGHTPGMIWAGLVARGANAERLTFGQTGLRWIGALITVCAGGLPALPAIWRRSFADWLSGSRVSDCRSDG
jgi:hypothetical protein